MGIDEKKVEEGVEEIKKSKADDRHHQAPEKIQGPNISSLRSKRARPHPGLLPRGEGTRCDAFWFVMAYCGSPASLRSKAALKRTHQTLRALEIKSDMCPSCFALLEYRLAALCRGAATELLDGGEAVEDDGGGGIRGDGLLEIGGGVFFNHVPLDGRGQARGAVEFVAVRGVRVEGQIAGAVAGGGAEQGAGADDGDFAGLGGAGGEIDAGRFYGGKGSDGQRDELGVEAGGDREIQRGRVYRERVAVGIREMDGERIAVLGHRTGHRPEEGKRGILEGLRGAGDGEVHRADAIAAGNIQGEADVLARLRRYRGQAQNQVIADADDDAHLHAIGGGGVVDGHGDGIGGLGVGVIGDPSDDAVGRVYGGATGGTGAQAEGDLVGIGGRNGFAFQAGLGGNGVGGEGGLAGIGALIAIGIIGSGGEIIGDTGGEAGDDGSVGGGGEAAGVAVAVGAIVEHVAGHIGIGAGAPGKGGANGAKGGG